MLSKIVSMALGLFFLVSGIGKLLDVLSFLITVNYLGLPDWPLMIVSVGIPPIEIILGLSLLLFVQNKLSAFVAMCLLLAFTTIFIYSHFVKHLDKCGCFGVISPLESTPTVSIARNLVCAALSFFLYRNPVPPINNKLLRWRLPLITVVGAAAFALSGISMNTPLYTTEPLLMKKIQDTPLAPLVHTSRDSTYLIFVMSTTCPHCWDATENVKAYKTNKKVDRIIALALGNDSSTTVYKQHFNPDFDFHLLPWDSLKHLTSGFPKFFFIRKDSIVKIQNAEISNPWSEELE